MDTTKLTTPDGFTFELPTPEAAGRLYQSLASGAPRKKRAQKGKTKAENNGKPESPSFGLSELGTKILKAIKNSPGGIATDDLARAIGIPSAKLPPMIRAVRSALVQAGFDDPVLREVYHLGGKPKSKYQLSEGVLKGMMKD